MSKTRTDIHRPSTFVPANYTYVLSYSLTSSSDGMQIPSHGVNCELDRRVYDLKGNVIEAGKHNEDGLCCVVGLLHVAKVKMAGDRGTGNCTVCGASFIHGDVWRHNETGECIHLGHSCADKYAMLANRTAHDMRLRHLKKAAASQAQAAVNKIKRADFLAANPGLEEALELEGHYILSDLRGKFERFCTLSPKQVELAFKLAHEIRNPKPAEKHVDAPTGRVTFIGEAVSVKWHDNAYGGCLKMTVKVTTDEGSWLCWTTVPAAMDSIEKGDRVEITATLSHGDNAYFAFGKRPVGRLLTEEAA